MQNVDKNNQTEEFIETIRRRFPVEKEVDRVLTRKMRQRNGPSYTPVTLETLKSGVKVMVRANHEGTFEISDVRCLGGGASKLQMAFSLSWG